MEPLIDKNTKRWIALMKVGARLGCHQMADRSFSYKGYQFPVCARCTGIIIGEIIAIIAMLFTLKIDLLYSFVLVVPLAIDGGIQYINLVQSNNIRRVVTGVLAGFGLTYVYAYFLSFVVGFVLQLFC